MNLQKLHTELQRRNVYKSSLAYLAISWVIIQVLSILLPLVEAPIWVMKTITLMLFIGFPIWVIFSWKYDITPEGIQKIEPAQGNTLTGKGKLINKLILFAIALAITAFAINYKLNKSNNELDDSSKEKPVLSTNLKALEFYNKGEFNQKKETLSHINLAISNYESAIELDSGFAMAYNNLASAYMRKNLSFEPDVKWEEEAYAAANIALQLDPSLASPHVIKGQFYWSPSHNFAHIEAINEFNNAISKDSNLSIAYEQLALVQLHVGLFDEAFKNAQTSIKLDPSNYRARRFIAEIYLFQGNYKEALKEFEKIPSTFAPEPTQSFRALTLVYLNQEDKALDLILKMLKDYPTSPHFNAVYAILLGGQGDFNMAMEKMKLAEENIDNFIHAHHIYYYLGISSSIIKQNQEAIAWLEKSAATGFPNYLLYSSDPMLKGLKKEQKFKSLLDQLKQDWEEFKSL